MSQIKVAILGGGVGALTAAYYLTQPALGKRYKVTVYQQGFRLGGKCATGRGSNERIEEHGLHMLLGFYERTFALLRPMFDEWQRKHGSADHPFRTFDDAFEPMHELTVMEQVNGNWQPWTIRLPGRAGKPGVDPIPLDGRKGFYTLLNRLMAVINLVPNATSVSDGFGMAPRRIIALLKFTAVVLKGMLIDVPDGNLDKLDDLEIREWLQLHGLSEALSEWVPVRLIYDLGFAYLDGDSSDVKRGRAAAGVTLRIMLRCLLGYRQAPLFRMKAGMADTVFTPLYRVLKDREVSFEFFHRVTGLKLSRSGQQVEEITLERQVELEGVGEYDPLVKGGDLLERWPSQPKWELLKGVKGPHSFEAPTKAPNGQERVLKLRDEALDPDASDRDTFDQVVLGISLGGLPGLSPDLEKRADWRAMLSGITTVKTQAAQLWFEEQPVGPNGGRLFCTAASPFNTASDMSDLLPREGWPAAHPPKALHYVVTSLPETGPPGMSDEQRARDNLFKWLANEASAIWSNVGNARLYHPDPNADDGARRAFQVVKVPENPSDRYVQSFPGSIQKRVPSKLPGIENLALAGDWVHTGLNVGCVESAVQGGIQAANVVQGLTPIRVD